MKTLSKSVIYLMYFLFVLVIISCSNSSSTSGIQISFSNEHYSTSVDGRLILLISNEIETEPRFQLRDDAKTCQGFGMDINGWNANDPLTFDKNSFGYPVQSFIDLPSGEYYVQVLFS